MGVTTYRLCHIPLARSNSQVPPTFKKKVSYKIVTHWESPLECCYNCWPQLQVRKQKLSKVMWPIHGLPLSNRLNWNLWMQFPGSIQSSCLDANRHTLEQDRGSQSPVRSSSKDIQTSRNSSQVCRKLASSVASVFLFMTPEFNVNKQNFRSLL